MAAEYSFRYNRAHMKKFVVLLVLAAAVAFAVWFGMRGKVLSASSSATVTALLPKETLALVHLPDFNRTREEWHQSDLYKLWREPALQEFVEKPLTKVPRAGAVREKVQDLESLGMRDAFLAVTAWENNQPKVIAGFRFKGSADDAEKIIGKWRARLERDATGITRSTVEHEKHQMNLTTRDTVTIATVYDGNWFLAANTVDLLKTVLDRVDGRLKGAPATLGSDEHYSAAFKHMPMGYAAFVFARLDAYFEKLAARLPDAAQNPQVAALRQIRSFAAATSFENGKVRDVLFVGMPKRDDAGELTRGSLPLATANAFLYATSLLHLPKQLTLPDPAGAAATGWPAKFQQKIAALGAKGVTLDEFNSAFAPEGSLVGEWPENTRIPALLASLPVHDVEKANRIVAAFTAVADEDRPWTRSEKGGVQYYTLPPANPMVPFAPTIAVGNQLLLAGIDPASVEAGIARAGGGSSQLSGAQAFKTAETLVPKPTQSFTFLDTALLYARLDAAVRPMLIMSAAFMPGIGEVVDLGKVPAPEVITKHLSPIVMSQIYQNDGYVTESIGPVSIYQAVLGVAGASGAAATLYKAQTAAAGGGGAVPPAVSSPSIPAATPLDDEDSTEEP